MLSYLHRGRRARISDRPLQANNTLNDARLDAWAIMVGEIRSADGGRYRLARPHRGDLPDVDFRLVAPARRGPPLLVQLVRSLASRLNRGAGATINAAPDLGESPPPFYMGVTEAGDPAAFLRCQPEASTPYPRAA